VRPAGDQPGPPRPDRFWSTIAIVAIILATAGWTTTGVLLLTGRAESAAPAASAVPTDEAAVPSDLASEPDDVSSHEAPELEALLPATLEGTPLSAQSWAGENVFLPQDPWSTAMRAFVAKKQLDVAGFSIARTQDPDGGLDLTIDALQLTGATPAVLMEGMTAAFTAADDTFKTSQTTVAGKKVWKGVSTQTALLSFWLPGNGVVFDVETEDAALATAAIKALIGGAAPASASPKPSGPTPS
jgi:hypothetical protein